MKVFETKNIWLDSMKMTHPPEFTHLIAEVVDLAMKAVVQPDPSRYIHDVIEKEISELKRLRRELPNERRLKPELASEFRIEILRKRIIRDLARLAIENFARLQHAAKTIDLDPYEFYEKFN